MWQIQVSSCIPGKILFPHGAPGNNWPTGFLSPYVTSEHDFIDVKIHTLAYLKAKGLTWKHLKARSSSQQLLCADHGRCNIRCDCKVCFARLFRSHCRLCFFWSRPNINSWHVCFCTAGGGEHLWEHIFASNLSAAEDASGPLPSCKHSFHCHAEPVLQFFIFHILIGIFFFFFSWPSARQPIDSVWKREVASEKHEFYWNSYLRWFANQTFRAIQWCHITTNRHTLLDKNNSIVDCHLDMSGFFLFFSSLQCDTEPTFIIEDLSSSLTAMYKCI